jgi:predicted metal-dependent phosphoesterase TrpH
MAHPFATRRGRVVGHEVIEAMAQAGLAGLEVHHRDHSADQVRLGLKLAKSLDLLVTGSSDYHGVGKSNLLGENTTDPLVLEAIEALATGAKVLRP